MPELPEVETIVRDIRPALVGRRCLRAVLTHDDVLRGVTRRALLRGLASARITAVTRRAKHAVIATESRRLVVQPGMTGSLVVYARPLSPEERRYAVLTIELEGGRRLVYRDVRRLGTLLWLDPKGWEAYDRALGPEPLGAEFSASRLRGILAGSRAAVKKVIMDQRALVGVGNIYANEALFAAGIDPSKPAHLVAPGSADRLHHHIVRILEAAIRAQGTTIRDYRTGTGQPGRHETPVMRCASAVEIGVIEPLKP